MISFPIIPQSRVKPQKQNTFPSGQSTISLTSSFFCSDKTKLFSPVESHPDDSSVPRKTAKTKYISFRTVHYITDSSVFLPRQNEIIFSRSGPIMITPPSRAKPQKQNTFPSGQSTISLTSSFFLTKKRRSCGAVLILYYYGHLLTLLTISSSLRSILFPLAASTLLTTTLTTSPSLSTSDTFSTLFLLSLEI